MLALLVLCSTCALHVTENEEKSFVSWMRETSQFFLGEEYHIRFGIWLANARIVSEHKGNFEIELNKFAAMTPAEYRTLLGARIDLAEVEAPPPLEVEYDPPWDWRNKGTINPIKDQGQCGSCYAFSAIGAAESVDAVKSGKLLSFSESNVIDCAHNCGGCGGGWPSHVYKWFIEHQNGKFMLESDYPYAPHVRQCQWNAAKGVGSVTSHVALDHDPEQMCTRCQKSGALSVCIDAARVTFQLYKTGIYDDPKCSSSRMDHAVILVGWGFEGAKKFWIVRNSWGLTWGEKGYIRILRKDNLCGVETKPVLMVP
jgi:cathepsin L